MEQPIVIKLSVEQMKQNLQIAYFAYMDGMKEMFDKMIKEETESFIKYGLVNMVKEEAKLIIRNEFQNQIRNYLRELKPQIIEEVKEEMKQQAQNTLKDMVFDVLGNLKKDDY